MSEATEKEQRSLQSDLDQEQAVVDLDQGIADREQARVDREQEPLDAAAAALAAGEPELHGVNRSDLDRSTDLGLQQDRQDAHQAQIDQTQLAQGVRQDVLDEQQVDLDTDSQIAPNTPDDQAIAVEELQAALRLRAEETLARAEAARQRAADGLLRLEAAQSRQLQRHDRRP